MRIGRAGPIVILTYHSLDASGSAISLAPHVFEDHMKRLNDLGFRGIALREAVAHLAATGSWPADRVVLTFDDGYANFYEIGYPILSRYNFKATLFLVTQHVGGWNDWETAPKGLGRQSILSWSQVVELAAAGIEIGAHTRTHPNLCDLPDGTVADEIVAARKDIESHVAQAVESFAYPFGRVSAAAEDVVRREFRAACTTELRRANQESPTRLPRIDAYYLRSRDSLGRLLKGQLDHYLTLRRWGRMVRASF
jgi:peptidoglycan/xylan/chitin deacetylase (PgdA/CDA1 family)